EFAFIIAGLGVALEILPTEGRDLVLAGALLSICANPVIFGLLDIRERRLAREEAERVAAQPPPPREGPELPQSGHAILVGFGRVGGEIARLLRTRGVPLLVIEDDADLVKKARAGGCPTLRRN